MNDRSVLDNSLDKKKGLVRETPQDIEGITTFHHCVHVAKRIGFSLHDAGICTDYNVRPNYGIGNGKSCDG